MCDLWRGTTVEDTPRGAIPQQIETARRGLIFDHRTYMKLYNAGSFFDPRAVPEDDYEPIARAVSGIERVIVESHPALIGRRVERLLLALETACRAGTQAPALEVAMGLETAHPDALERLHKRMTLDDFADAARRLRALGVALRVFLLVHPPFIPRGEQDHWLARSVDVALACGAEVVSLVPTRPGNGALDALADEGFFAPPTLVDVERSHAAARRAAGGRGRVFMDTWDLERFASCDSCAMERRRRVEDINLSQVTRAPVVCDVCHEERHA